MYQFIESIKLKDGEIFNLFWHQKRVNDTFDCFFKGTQPINLQEIINVQNIPQKGFYKIRIVYNDVDYSIEIQAYNKRIIQSFEIIETNFDYPFKSTDREFLNSALKNSKKDEVIFSKNSFITDSSYSNLVFYDGKEWFTPNTFLLNGTTRQRLLSENKIKEIPIKTNDIHQFKKIGFINALNDLGENVINL